MSESTAESATKKSRSAPKGRPTPKKNDKVAIRAAYHKAKMQWYALGAVFVLAVIAAIVLLTIYTEGNAGSPHG